MSLRATDREAAERLRAALGITERAPSFTGALATPAEMRALRAALQLTGEQLGARLGIAPRMIGVWEAGTHAVRPRRTEVRKRLQHMLALARERGLLRHDPGPGTVLRATHGASPLRRDHDPVVTFRCTACGKQLRRMEVRSAPGPGGVTDLLHLVDGMGCGPVRPQDRRERKPSAAGIDAPSEAL